MSWIAELDEVKTDHVEPLASVTGHALPMRDDVVTDGNRLDDILSNVPEGAAVFLLCQRLLNNV